MRERSASEAWDVGAGACSRRKTMTRVMNSRSAIRCCCCWESFMSLSFEAGSQASGRGAEGGEGLLGGLVEEGIELGEEVAALLRGDDLGEGV